MYADFELIDGQQLIFNDAIKQLCPFLSASISFFVSLLLLPPRDLFSFPDLRRMCESAAAIWMQICIGEESEKGMTWRWHTKDYPYWVLILFKTNESSLSLFLHTKDE